MSKAFLLSILLNSVAVWGQALQFSHQETVRMKNSTNKPAELGSELIVYATLMQRKSWLQYCFEKQLLLEDIKSTVLNFEIRLGDTQQMTFSESDFLNAKHAHIELRKCIHRALDKTSVPEALKGDYQVHLVFQSS